MQHIDVRGRFLLILGVTLLALGFYHTRGLKLAQDLRGGTSLRFSMDIAKARAEGRILTAQDDAEVVGETLGIISQRIDIAGLLEIELVDLKENRFEINLPTGSDGDIESIVNVVTTLGDLQFRVEVLPDERYDERRSEDGGYQRQRSKVWTRSSAEFEPFKEAEVKLWQAAQAGGTPYLPSQPPYRVVPKRGIPTTQGAVAFAVIEDPATPAERFDGSILENPDVSKGDSGQPVTVFDVKNKYRGGFESWTSRNVRLPMAIILNGEYTMAPYINQPLSDRVEVTLGYRSYEAAQKEAQELKTTLQTGSLKLRPVLESRTKVGARLAGESRDRGVLATIVSLVLVLIFMLVYYRWMGMVANFALILNLVLLVGALAFCDAALSLPGIAGIVLTLGVAVDANILINERIREERALGRNLHRALAEGYSRALTTIVDANMTSIITAVFLYAYGSGAIKGFAVALTLGLVISMFTAVFVTRAVFEWQIKRGTLKEFRVLGSGKVPTIRWMALRKILVPISVGAVIFGIVAFATTDRFTLYDIDFTGGQKVQMRFAGPVSVDEVKQGLEGETVEVEVASTYFDEAGELQTRRQKVSAGPYDGAEVFTAGGGGDAVELKIQRATSRTDLTAEEEEQALRGFLTKRFGERLLPAWTTGLPKPFERTPPVGDGPEEGEAPPAPPPAPAPAPAPAPDAGLDAVKGGSSLDIAFVDPQGALTPQILESVLTKDFPHYVHQGKRRAVPASEMSRHVVVRPRTGASTSVRAFDAWIKTTAKESALVVDPDPADLGKDLEQWLASKEFRGALERELGPEGKAKAEDLALSLPFPSQDQISSSVAERLKGDAQVALLLSFLGIIVYVALRFRSRSMGIASVLCLFHDVAVTAGVVAVVNSLGLVDARVNLTMVAAFLTLVGLSINDTVVIYDRIRENRGQRTLITSEIIDLSINQTFGRTLKTITTILLVCCSLFFFNYGQRNVLEGFAFCLIVGSFVGTYSTIAISAPLLLYLPWLWSKIRGLAPSNRLVAMCADHWSLTLLLPIAVVLWAAWALAFGLYAFAVGLLLFTPWALSGKEPSAAAA